MPLLSTPEWLPTRSELEPQHVPSPGPCVFPPQHCLTLPRLPSLPARAPRTPSLTLPRRAHSRLQLCTARPPAWNPLLSAFLVACSLTFPKSLLQCHLLKEEAPPPRPVHHRLSQWLANVGNQSHHPGTRVKSGRCRPLCSAAETGTVR